MKIKDRFLTVLGLGPTRKLPPPHYVAIAPGLLVTTTKAEAWFVIRTANTQTLDETRKDSQLAGVMKRATKALNGVDCHLKIIWGQVSGEEYAADMQTVYTAGDWPRWVAENAAFIEGNAIPERYVLLGVTLDAARATAGASGARDAVDDVMGLRTGGKLSSNELARLQGQMQKISRQLSGSELGSRVASPDVIAWMLAREQRTGVLPLPGESVRTGASLAHLTMGRVLPYTDHLRFFDGRGALTCYGRVLVFSQFPQVYDSNDEKPWLLSLSSISRMGETEDDLGAEVPVIADASVRFRVLSPQTAAKTLDSSRKLAREQRREASKGAAEEPSAEWEDAENNLREMGKIVRRDGVALVQHYARLMVTGSSYDELEQNTAAVVNHYADSGIVVSIGEDEQKDLWLEALPGDQVRAADLSHLQTQEMFFSSWFWGGSHVGARSGEPVIACTTGATQNLVRFDAIGGGKRGESSTTALLGRSGLGKTTLLMLSELNAAFQGAWVVHLDYKGEAAGVSHAARSYGLNSEVTRVGREHSGAFDLFRVFPADEAITQVSSQLSLMAPRGFAQIVETATMAGATAVAKEANAWTQPSTWAVIQWLMNHDREDYKELGNALETMTQTPIGSIVAGKPSGARVLREEPGLWVLQLPNLVLPSSRAGSDASTWDVQMRLGLAAMRAVMAYSMHISSSASLRAMPKLISVPEVHRMLRVADGADFLDQVARLGRAYFTNLILDSQDVEGVASVEGVVEQISSVFGFQLQTKRQQDALAELLQMPADENTRNLIYDIGVEIDADGESQRRKGHPIYRDHKGQAATIQVYYATDELARLLSTNPDATANVVDFEESAAAHVAESA